MPRRWMEVGGVPGPPPGRSRQQSKSCSGTGGGAREESPSRMVCSLRAQLQDGLCHSALHLDSRGVSLVRRVLS